MTYPIEGTLIVGYFFYHVYKFGKKPRELYRNLYFILFSKIPRSPKFLRWRRESNNVRNKKENAWKSCSTVMCTFGFLLGPKKTDGTDRDKAKRAPMIQKILPGFLGCLAAVVHTPSPHLTVLFLVLFFVFTFLVPLLFLFLGLLFFLGLHFVCAFMKLYMAHLLIKAWRNKKVWKIKIIQMYTNYRLFFNFIYTEKICS